MFPWDWQAFADRACEAGHPIVKLVGMPPDLHEVVSKHVEWSDEQLCKYGVAWCRKWVVRAKQLDAAEEEGRGTS